MYLNVTSTLYPTLDAWFGIQADRTRMAKTYFELCRPTVSLCEATNGNDLYPMAIFTFPVITDLIF